MWLSSGNIVSNPRIFAAPDTQLAWVKRFCSINNPLSQLGIDMTYKIGPFYVTTLVMQMPIFVLKKNPTKHPHVVVGLSVSGCKQYEDYAYLSRNLKLEGKIQSLIYGTDGEPAIEKAFEETFPIEGMFLLDIVKQ